MPVTVIKRPNENDEQLLKRFRKAVLVAGILKQHRFKRWFMSKAEVRRMKRKKAIRKLQRRSTKPDLKHAQVKRRARDG